MNALTPSTYQKLIDDISHLYKNAQKSLAEFYFGTGQRIVEIEQKGEARAPRGTSLLKQLSQDLTARFGRGFSVKNLERMRYIYLHKGKSSAPTINWTQQVELMSLRDEKARRLLEKKAIRENLTSREIREAVQKIKARSSLKTHDARPTTTLLTPVRGKLFTYQIVKKGGALYLDRGFRNYQKLTRAQAARYKENDIVENLPGEGLRLFKSARKNELYTYEAELDRVYDADTQWYFIFTDRLDARGMRNDKLRLRGIDCPELKTAAGKAAKKFVEDLFSRTEKIQVTTTKPDKFDRYLSDIFLQMKNGTEIFLNNELLKTGHARLYSDIKPEDWDE